MPEHLNQIYWSKQTSPNPTSIYLTSNFEVEFDLEEEVSGNDLMVGF
jgi:hypothetical protein